MANLNVRKVFVNDTLAGSNNYYIDISRFEHYEIWIDHPGNGTLTVYRTPDLRSTDNTDDPVAMAAKEWGAGEPVYDQGGNVATSIDLSTDTSPASIYSCKKGVLLRVNINTTGDVYGVIFGWTEKYE